MKSNNSEIYTLKIPYMATIFAIALCLILIIGLLFIKSPGMSTGRFYIYGDCKPQSLIAMSRGKLTILPQKDSLITEDSELGYIDFSGDYNEISHLLKILNNSNDILKIGKELTNNKFQKLGDITDFYLDFLNSYNEYVNTSDKATFDIELEGYKKYREYLQKSIISIKDKASNENEKFQIAALSYKTDSSLYDINAINIQDFQNSHMNYLKSIEAKLNLDMESDRLYNSIEDIENKSSLLKERKKEELIRIKHDILIKYNRLKASLKDWKTRNVLVSDINGILENPLNLSNGQTVTEGTEIFRIIPENKTNICKIYFSNINSSRIKVGSTVKFYPDNFDRQEFGYLIGKIKKIDKALINLDSQNNNWGYTAEADIDINNQPWFKGECQFINGTTGSAEIIFRNQSLYSEITQWITNKIN